ncbi:MAG: ferredoxin [Bacilli bacterium]|nr:ferredoxin [Bacilli bacterium]
MAKKKVKVDESLCMGCGACAGSYPDDFQIGDSGLAEAITGEGDEEAASVCPFGAISVEE